MTTEMVYRRTVLDIPHDDESRLAYADWLDERCDPLGEFIRVQCRLAQPIPDNQMVIELERRQSELLHEFEDQWVGDLRELVDWYAFQGGFVAEVALSAERFLCYSRRLFELAPIQEVHLHHVDRRSVERLAKTRDLERLRHLDLSANRLGHGGMRFLARSAYVSKLRRLNLSSTGLGDRGVMTLTQSSYLGRLRELFLGNNHIGDAGGQALADAQGLDDLEVLWLDLNRIGPSVKQCLRRRFGDRVHF